MTTSHSAFVRALRDFLSLCFGALAFVVMVFFILCAPSFLGGSVPVHRAPMMIANR
ncbi:hypothetical protein [Gluconobacter japonicus]|uniref:hypothetical protein n=1 Tax=Gluconobacter japonicus TaxID=376620 RepID=UPI000A549318|nr:hypothetical protein [Gluconobacter japonicus]